MDWTGSLYVVVPLALAAGVLLLIYPMRLNFREAPRPVSSGIPLAREVIGWIVVVALLIVAMTFAV
jgi:hypothetical protein